MPSQIFLVKAADNQNIRLTQEQVGSEICCHERAYSYSKNATQAEAGEKEEEM